MPAEELPSQHHQKLLSWRSPSHPFRLRTPFELKEAAFRIGILVIFAVFFKWFLFAAVIIAFAFVLYMVSTVEPEEVEHSIDKNGVTSAGVTYIWEDLDYCYFSTVYGQDVLVIVTFGSKPLHLTLLLGKQDRDQLHQVMEDYIPVKHPPAPTLLDRIQSRVTSWFALD